MLLFCYWELGIILQLYKIGNIQIMSKAQANSSDSIDPQFLTFRHNSPQTVLSSGRTIYSQRLDYKSLQKYPIFDGSNSQRHDMNERTNKKTKQSTKQKHMRTVKSQEKYKQLFPANHSNSNAEELFEEDSDENFGNGSLQYDEGRSLKSEAKYRKSCYNYNYRQKQQIKATKVTKNTADIQEVVQKNTQLKLKLNKLLKNMKKEQKKQHTQQQHINELENDIEEYNRQIQDQNCSMKELRQICQENMKECNRIREDIYKVSQRNQEIAANLENLEESVDSSEISREVSKQDQVKDRVFCAKLKEGMSELTKLKTTTDLRLAKLYQQIQALQYQIEQMKSQENDLLKIFGFSVEQKNQNLSQNQSNSHNSSNGSNRQSLYYY